MDFPIRHSRFADGALVFRTHGLLRASRVFVNGVEQTVWWSKTFDLPDIQGKTARVKVCFVIFDPVPTIEIDGERLELAPPLKVHQRLLIYLPLSLALVGGGIGGLAGGFAAMGNAWAFRVLQSTIAMYLVSTAFSIAALVFWLSSIQIINRMFPGLLRAAA